MEREHVLFVVESPDGVAEFAEAFPIVNAYVTLHFVPFAEFPVEGGRPARVSVHRSATAAPTYASTTWPCPSRAQ